MRENFINQYIYKFIYSNWAFGLLFILIAIYLMLASMTMIEVCCRRRHFHFPHLKSNSFSCLPCLLYSLLILIYSSTFLSLISILLNHSMSICSFFLFILCTCCSYFIWGRNTIFNSWSFLCVQKHFCAHLLNWDIWEIVVKVVIFSHNSFVLFHSSESFIFCCRCCRRWWLRPTWQCFSIYKLNNFIPITNFRCLVKQKD